MGINGRKFSGRSYGWSVKKQVAQYGGNIKESAKVLKAIKNLLHTAFY
jgi:hypothetical protein